MKNRLYVDKMNEIHANEDLIQKTINSVNDMNKRKKVMRTKKILAGAASFILVSVGSVGAYVAISGNTQILEKIGIKLSQNYEQSEQKINEENSYQSVISVDGIEAKLKSVAVDNDSLVMEIDLNLDESISCQNPNLKVKSINIYRASNQSNIGEEVVITEKNSVQKMEDGTYKLFKYLAISDPAVATNNFWYDIFYKDETVNCTVTFDELVDEDGNEIVKAQKDNNEWNFTFDINKPNNLSEVNLTDESKDSFYFNDVQIDVKSIQVSSFGNIVTVNATEKNIDYDKINEIQKLKFIVKDSNGNVLNIVSRTQNITATDYKEGKCNTITLEDIQLIVDDSSNDTNYTIEVVEDDTINVTSKELKDVNDSIVKDMKSGKTVLTEDGVSYPMGLLTDADEFYQDKYGVYLIDKTVDELSK